MRPYDALAKAHGAKGIDIDERTADGRRVIAEIKTTGAFGHRDMRGPQKDAVIKDIERLRQAQADYKFFFVVDPDIFSIIRRRHASHLDGITLVLLPDGQEFAAT